MATPASAWLRQPVLQEQDDEHQVAEQERGQPDHELVDHRHQRDVAPQAQREGDDGDDDLAGGAPLTNASPITNTVVSGLDQVSTRSSAADRDHQLATRRARWR